MKQNEFRKAVEKLGSARASKVLFSTLDKNHTAKDAICIYRSISARLFDGNRNSLTLVTVNKTYFDEIGKKSEESKNSSPLYAIVSDLTLLSGSSFTSRTCDYNSSDFWYQFSATEEQLDELITQLVKCGWNTTDFIAKNLLIDRFGNRESYNNMKEIQKSARTA